ncbi:stalk domain-containing protein [Aminipila terrae]|uniref:Copper amine oxidase-like N-terminal domain-containing protein n=1 Tax=Aminipila terrae TaxID=2697030 RepID=A0A6P1MA45_9FIRM|nr:stalk domain-containing protein [Aminipila terrae]QHI71569.1 hypothetical protein Ami3637_03485 [Aminipila terrae]
MKKRILLSVVILSMALSNFVWADAMYAPRFQVNGKDIVFSSETGFPYISQEGRAMMPLRACLDAIGCQVSWNQEEKTAILSKGYNTIKVTVNQKYIYVNDKQIKADCSAILKNGRIYLPLRVVMESLGYTVDWQGSMGTVVSNELTPWNINGGTTGIFSRQQLNFEGFDGIEADVTLPYVNIAEKGDCPYVYFGLDWNNDQGNVEGGFQFIEDAAHPGYNKWTVFMRQGGSWLSGSNSYLEQGSKHHLKLYAQNISKDRTDMVVELDGNEVARKPSDRTDFDKASAKAVVSMAMSKVFDGGNCFSQSKGAKLENVRVSQVTTDSYLDFNDFGLYHKWNPEAGKQGMWFGTAECIPDYIHIDKDGSISIYKSN